MKKARHGELTQVALLLDRRGAIYRGGPRPTFIFIGQFDSVTPPEMSQIAAEMLPQAQLVDVPNAMHSILGNHGDCPTQMAQNFLDSPGDPVDTACTQAMRVHFATSDAALP